MTDRRPMSLSLPKLTEQLDALQLGATASVGPQRLEVYVPNRRVERQVAARIGAAFEGWPIHINRTGPITITSLNRKHR